MTNAWPDEQGARLHVERGTVLDDRYEILDFIGAGGFASVYRAHDLVEDRVVALKLLDGDSDLMDMETYRARFFREAEVATRIDHPNVVTIFDYGVAGRLGLPFLAMELLQGHDLEHEITAFGALDPTRAVRLFLPVLDALARGHALGIIHRDLKPANLFLCDPQGPNERLVVLDFGVAKVDDATAARLTATGQLFGTPVFAAPEWIRQQIATPALDVYQIGLILVEALSGEPVIREENPFECLNIHCQGRLELPVDLLFGPLGEVFSRALALDHTVRLQDAGELRDALATVELAQLPERIAPGPRRRLVQPPGSVIPEAPAMRPVTDEIEGLDLVAARRGRRVRVALALAAVVLLAGAIVAALTLKNDEPPAQAAVVTSEPIEPDPVTRRVLAASLHGGATSAGGIAEPAAVGSVRIESRPAGAEVFRGDVLLGTTPLDVGLHALTGAPLSLRLEHPGYASADIEVPATNGHRHVESLERVKRRDASDDKPALKIMP